MDSSSRPLVYLVLGTPGSGRRAILSDLIADGLTSADRALTVLPEAEAASEWDAKLGRAVRWSWRDGGFALDVPGLARGETADFTHLFIVADGRRNPVYQIESFCAGARRTSRGSSRWSTAAWCTRMMRRSGRGSMRASTSAMSSCSRPAKAYPTSG